MPITYDRKAVCDAVRAPVFSGRLYASQEAGIAAILTEWERLQPDGDPRFVAYMLATAAWETAHTMRPIEEYGHGRGLAYGHPAGPWHQVYYGRGLVQLTWQAGYQKATQRLRAKEVVGADIDLEKTPALALRPDIASAIMIFGMCDGWFTGKKLADYFNGVKSDWVDARRIINGLDKASTVAGYGEHFYAGLKAGLKRADAPSPAPAVHPTPQATSIPIPPPAGGCSFRQAAGGRPGPAPGARARPQARSRCAGSEAAARPRRRHAHRHRLHLRPLSRPPPRKVSPCSSSSPARRRARTSSRRSPSSASSPSSS